MRSRAQGAQEGSARPEISREFIAVHKRRRIMDAIAELSAEQGYDATKIGDIVRRAGVARKTLYDNFDGKEEVFLSAFDAAYEEVTRRVEGACAAAEGDWDERLAAGLAALLGYVAERPAMARMCLIEALSATPAAKERYEDALGAFVGLTGRIVPRDERLPETIDETVVGGVAWIVYQKVRRGEAARAEELLPELTEFMTAPYLGAAAADRTRI
ncbi:MAG TPA: helix-turn-helix domain-containing protein [Solirubrobacterales bacterium]